MAALRLVLTSFLLAAVLGGCSSLSGVGGLSSKERRLIESKKAAIVLLRVPPVPESGDPSPREGREIKDALAVRIVAIGETPDQPAECRGAGGRCALKAPSSESRERGWRYVVLPPGSYRLLPHRRLALSGYSFRLRVPRGPSLLYAGTFNFDCPEARRPSPFRVCAVTVADESGAAGALARTAFADYGPPSTALTRRYGEPIETAMLRSLRPVAVSSTGEVRWVPPDWWKRAKAKGYFAPSKELAKAPGSGLGPSSGYEALVAPLFWGAALAWLPIGAGLAKADASYNESKWGSCMEGLARQLRELDPAARLRRRLDEELQERGLAQAGEPATAEAAAPSAGGRLQVDIQRVQLRECASGGTFCFEVALRARLFDRAGDEALYDAAFAYTAPKRRIHKSEIGLASSELVVGPSQCRELSIVCGQDGRRLFDEELTEALDVLVKRILPEPA